MRKQRSGYIFQISSVGGPPGPSGQYRLPCSKWAVGGFTESLAQEVAPFWRQGVCPRTRGNAENGAFARTRKRLFCFLIDHPWRGDPRRWHLTGATRSSVRVLAHSRRSTRLCISVGRHTRWPAGQKHDCRACAAAPLSARRAEAPLAELISLPQ